MTDNLSQCPRCHVDFEPIDEVSELPLQAIRQQCPDCGYETDIGVVNYPDGTFAVIGRAIEDDRCRVVHHADGAQFPSRCDADAVVRAKRVGRALTPRCRDHLGVFEDVLALQGELG